MRFPAIVLAAVAIGASLPALAQAAVGDVRITSSTSGVPTVNCTSNDNVRFYDGGTYRLGTTYRALGPSVVYKKINGATAPISLDVYTDASRVSISTNEKNDGSPYGWAFISRATPGAGEYVVLQNGRAEQNHLINPKSLPPAARNQPVALLVNTLEVSAMAPGATSLTASYAPALRVNGALQFVEDGGATVGNFSWDPAGSAASREQKRACVTVYPSWCGDGVVDVNNGKDLNNNGLADEQCDLGAQNGQPGSTCSATCQTVAGPSCGTANGRTDVGGRPTDAGALCTAGTLTGTVAGIGTAGSPWTWTCELNGRTTVPACHADSSGLAACVAGPVHGAQNAPVTAATTGLCPAGQTVTANSFTPVVAGTATTYNWGCTLGGTATATDSQNGGNCVATYDTANPAACTSLTATPNAGVAPLTTNFACAGQNLGASPTYAIVVSSGATALATFNNSTGSYTFAANGNYAAQCTINGAVTSAACGQGGTVTITVGSLCGGANGGTFPSAPASGLCAGGSTLSGGVVFGVVNPNQWTWSCVNGTSVSACSATAGGGGPDNPGGPGTPTGGGRCVTGQTPSDHASFDANVRPSCIGAIPSSVTDHRPAQQLITWSCGTAANQCGVGAETPVVTGPVCGNGIVETGEACDGGPDCTATCTLIPPPPVDHSNPDSVLHYEMFGNVGLRQTPVTETSGTPYYGVIVGDGVPLIEKTSEAPCIHNEGSADRPVGQLCVAIEGFDGGQQTCMDVGTLAAGATRCMVPRTVPGGSDTGAVAYGNIAQAKGSTQGWAPGIAYQNKSVTLSIRRDGQDLYPASIQYRVARPAIGGINGGNAYVEDGAGFDVNKLTECRPADGADCRWDDLSTGNFLVTTVNNLDAPGRALSSLTKNLDAAQTSQNSAAISTQKEQDAAQLKAMAGLTANGNQPCAFEAASDAPACASAKTLACNAVPTGAPKNLEGVRTVFVKNGDLTIDADTAYGPNASQASWAWIAQNGNVVISPNVTRVAGVVMALCDASAPNPAGCGRIISENDAYTPKQLVVDGALYGDASDLVAHRTYIRGVDPASATSGRRESLTVGTVIKYSNRSLKCAPPLLEKFIERYSVKKVAR